MKFGVFPVFKHSTKCRCWSTHQLPILGSFFTKINYLVATKEDLRGNKKEDGRKKREPVERKEKKRVKLHNFLSKSFL
jgi:hypothetical protein